MSGTVNDAIFEKLSAIPVGASALDAVTTWTRRRMFCLNHIPNRYFLVEELQADLPALYAEMEKYGYVALDRDGMPAVLSGKPAVIPHDEVVA